MPAFKYLNKSRELAPRLPRDLLRNPTEGSIRSGSRAQEYLHSYLNFMNKLGNAAGSEPSPLLDSLDMVGTLPLAAGSLKLLKHGLDKTQARTAIGKAGKNLWRELQNKLGSADSSILQTLRTMISGKTLFHGTDVAKYNSLFTNLNRNQFSNASPRKDYNLGEPEGMSFSFLPDVSAEFGTNVVRAIPSEKLNADNVLIPWASAEDRETLKDAYLASVSNLPNKVIDSVRHKLNYTPPHMRNKLLSKSLVGLDRRETADFNRDLKNILLQKNKSAILHSPYRENEWELLSMNPQRDFVPIDSTGNIDPVFSRHSKLKKYILNREQPNIYNTDPVRYQRLSKTYEEIAPEILFNAAFSNR